MRCRPRTWPSMRRRRLTMSSWWATAASLVLVGVSAVGGLEAAQPEAVADHERGGEGHRRPGDQGVEQATGRERKRGDVVGEGPEEVGPDGAERLPGQPDRV